MVIQTWADVVATSLQNLWFNTIRFLPSLIGALVVVILGLIVSAGLGALVEKIFEAIKLDAMLSKLGIEPYFERAGVRLRGARFLGRLVYWFLMVAFFVAASDILGLSALSVFLRDVLLYIPNIAIAVLVMLVAVIVANVARRVVSSSVAGARLHASNFLGTLAWWAIVVFGFLTALIQLNIAPSVINTLITGFVVMLALAGGLAFGLGGKDYAAHLLNRLREQTEKK